RRLGAAAGDEVAAAVALAEERDAPRDVVAGSFDERALLGRFVRREDRRRLVVRVDLDALEALRGEHPGHAIAERVVSLAERRLAALARELEADEIDDVVDARARLHRV